MATWLGVCHQILTKIFELYLTRKVRKLSHAPRRRNAASRKLLIPSRGGQAAVSRADCFGGHSLLLVCHSDNYGETGPPVFSDY
jgi:hypothetical protein